MTFFRSANTSFNCLGRRGRRLASRLGWVKGAAAAFMVSGHGSSSSIHGVLCARVRLPLIRVPSAKLSSPSDVGMRWGGRMERVAELAQLVQSNPSSPVQSVQGRGGALAVTMPIVSLHVPWSIYMNCPRLRDIHGDREYLGSPKYARHSLGLPRSREPQSSPTRKSISPRTARPISLPLTVTRLVPRRLTQDVEARLHPVPTRHSMSIPVDPLSSSAIPSANQLHPPQDPRHILHPTGSAGSWVDSGRLELRAHPGPNYAKFRLSVSRDERKCRLAHQTGVRHDENRACRQLGGRLTAARATWISPLESLERLENPQEPVFG
ncbi:hypothetical protein JHW43_002977 [Diplocarpon mali]|nr:hypothetical protein JHW43_002977 [Diplocarpon mali]